MNNATITASAAARLELARHALSFEKQRLERYQAAVEPLLVEFERLKQVDNQSMLDLQNQIHQLELAIQNITTNYRLRAQKLVDDTSEMSRGGGASELPTLANPGPGALCWQLQ